MVPIPGCNHAVFPESANSVSTFTCKCLFTFCYKCLKEAHAPLSCATAERWRKEQLYQSKNRHLLAYTRKCLKCEWPVAVKAWSKHMECPACHFQSCRECNSSWLEHGHWEGDHHTHICPQAKLKAMFEDENKRAKSRNDYGRYQECLSLWNSQNTEQNQVLMKLRSMQNEELKAVAENQALPLEELSFVTDAWLQAVECKRVFKYTGVSNFYFHIFQEKPLCNDLIKNGAFVLEQLCLVAAELRMLVRKTVPAQQFEDFRKRLCLKTSLLFTPDSFTGGSRSSQERRASLTLSSSHQPGNEIVTYALNWRLGEEGDCFGGVALCRRDCLRMLWALR